MRRDPSNISPVGLTISVQQDHNAAMITIATGTGMALFCSIMRPAFVEKNPDKGTGKVWLLPGVITSILLYKDGFEEIKR